MQNKIKIKTFWQAKSAEMLQIASGLRHIVRGLDISESLLKVSIIEGLEHSIFKIDISSSSHNDENSPLAMLY